MYNIETKAYIDNESIVCALEGIDVWALTGYHPLEEGKKGSHHRLEQLPEQQVLSPGLSQC
jgi:hypothetical protein